MSLESNQKSLIGTLIKGINKQMILGSSFDTKPMELFSLIFSVFEYSLTQYNAGHDEYKDSLNILSRQLKELKDYCPDICRVRDAIIITRPNTAPTISNNTISIPISNSITPLVYTDVVSNFTDSENNTPSKIIIFSNTNEELYIDNNPVIVNDTYNYNVSFSVKYESGVDQLYFIKNSPAPCSSDIISTSKTDYDALIADGYLLLDSDRSGSMVFQKAISNMTTFPLDSFIYIHIDTNSFTVFDKTNLEGDIITWWNNFIVSNPLFTGTLIVNTIDNSLLNNGFALSRGGNGTALITGASTLYSGEKSSWLESPIQGLLHKSWKEGVDTYATEQDFLDYARGVNMFNLVLVGDQDNGFTGYNGNSTIGYIDGGIVQPTALFTGDYDNFTRLVRPQFRFFKGFIVVSKDSTNPNDNYLLHAISALEGGNITPFDMDVHLGGSKVASYGPINMAHKFYNWGTANPYIFNPLLRRLGWVGSFTDTSPSLTTYNTHLDNLILTDTPNTYIDEVAIPVSNLGNSVNGGFTLRVQDSHPTNPLWSNQGDITIQYTSTCETEYICDRLHTQSTGHGSVFYLGSGTYTGDAIDINTIESIRLDGVSSQFGNALFTYKNKIITGDDFPLVISGSDFSNGSIELHCPRKEGDLTACNLVFSVKLLGTDNFCNGSPSTMTVTCLAGTTPVPSVVLVSQSLIKPITVNTLQTTIPSTITYAALGDPYSISWTQNSGPSTATIQNPGDENVIISDLSVGTYTFQMRVVTISGDSVTNNVGVEVTENIAPVVNAGIDQTIAQPTSSTTLIGTVSDSDGSITSTLWSQIQGPSTAVITTPTNTTTTITGLSQVGVYIFNLTATDNIGDSASDTIIITITT